MSTKQKITDLLRGAGSKATSASAPSDTRVFLELRNLGAQVLLFPLRENGNHDRDDLLILNPPGVPEVLTNRRHFGASDRAKITRDVWDSMPGATKRAIAFLVKSGGLQAGGEGIDEYGSLQGV